MNQFARFLFAGAFAAAVNLGSRFFLNFFVDFEAAVAIAYLIGMATAYTLARLFVFDRSGRSIKSEAQRFVVVNIVSFIVAWSTSVFLARYLFPSIGVTSHVEDLAHLVGVGAPILTSYIGHKFYTFEPLTPFLQKRGRS